MQRLFHWTYAGVDVGIPGTGGPECMSYLDPTTLTTEALCATVMAGFFLWWAWRAPRGLVLPLESSYMPRESATRRGLLLAHVLVFGAECGFKLATKTLIWLVNPCHVITMTQIILLAFPATPLTTALYRIHLHMMNGPLLALIFPVLNTRLLPNEQLIYYVQHVFILLLPLFLMKEGGVFTHEPYNNFSWAMVSFALQSTYHFIVLQYISLSIGINLDNMICPAVSDPFNGPHYRKFAYVHQMLMILFLGKCMTYLYQTFLDRFFPNKTTTPTINSIWQKPEISLEEAIHRPGFFAGLFRRQVLREEFLLEQLEKQLKRKKEVLYECGTDGVGPLGDHSD